MDYLAERNEKNNGLPRRKEKNKKWDDPAEKKKRTMDDPAESKYEPTERKEMNHGRPSRK